MQLEITSDTICPWCFIGKRRLDAARALRPDFPLEILWRPFQLNPDMPREGLNRQEYLAAKFGDAGAVEQRLEFVRETGRSVGIPFAFERIGRVPNTLDSHRLILWAERAGRQDAVVEALFQRYFIDGADIGDPDVLVAAAASAGMSAETVRDELAGEAGLDLVRGQCEAAVQRGVSGVPCFVFGGRYGVSGAQEPERLVQVFDALARLASDGGEAAAATG
ncbi:MAG: DsbA family oxidoreductase [Alphaproteobacteria bacterium]|nr:DsbA family oxidoreductase [Alphaproteobacteria bacterium]